MTRCSNNKKLGRVHSLESFGAHEGPGIRYVVFLQGCLARCLYCQNPDTWDVLAGKLMSAEEVFLKVEECLPYIRSSGGGVTVSGGEPLLQIDFLTELFKLCKKQSIHTAVDTSCFYYPEKDAKKMKALLRLTGLFIVDIKAAEPKLHKKLTQRKLDEALSFIGILEKNKIPYWLRYVLVPGVNDSQEHINLLDEILKSLNRCQKFEFLPYHTLGKHKWKHMGMKYSLKDVPAATEEDVKKAYKILSWL